MNRSNKNTSFVNFNSESLPTRRTATIWLSAVALQGLSIVVLNILTIATIVLNKGRLRRRFMYCVVNLAIADILYGVFGSIYEIFSFVLFLNNPNDSSSSIDLNRLMAVGLFALILSLLSLVLVSLERVFATFFPHRYRIVSYKAYLAAFAISWCLALIVSLFFRFERHIEDIPDIFASSNVIRFLYILSLGTLITSYTAIYIKIKLQGHIQEQQPNQQQIVIQRREKDKNLAITLFIVTALSMATWIPYIIVRVIHSFRLTFLEIFKITPNVVSATFFIQACNSLINPVVYLFRMKDFRKALFFLVCKRSRYTNELAVHPSVATTNNAS